VAERSKSLDRSQPHRRPIVHKHPQLEANRVEPPTTTTTTDLCCHQRLSSHPADLQSSENSRAHPPIGGASAFGGGLRINSSYWVVFNTCCAQLVASGFSLNVQTSSAAAAGGGGGATASASSSFGASSRDPDDNIPEYYPRPFEPQYRDGPGVAGTGQDSDADAEDEPESEEIETESETEDVEELISSSQHSLSSSPPCPSITPPPLPPLFVSFPSSTTSFDPPPHMRRCRDSDSDSPPSASSHHIASPNAASAAAAAATVAATAAAAAARSGNLAPVLTASRTGAAGAGAAWYATDTGTYTTLLFFFSSALVSVRSILHPDVCSSSTQKWAYPSDNGFTQLLIGRIVVPIKVDSIFY
jgi:hypothetical protein